MPWYKEIDVRELTCIVCPVGCSLTVDETPSRTDNGEMSVTGNRCQRGKVYAQEEVRAPKRTVTATCRIGTDSHAIKRIPVKTTVPCPKERIPALLADIYKAELKLPVNRGDTVISNWNGLEMDVVATRTVTE